MLAQQKTENPDASSFTPYHPNMPKAKYSSSFYKNVEKPAITEIQSKSHKGASKRRSIILIEATRCFCRLDRPEDKDINTYKEFFYQFIESLTRSDKRIVAALLARMDYTPRSIALYLSMEALDVAAPFLLFSPVLSETDLRAIGVKMGADYKRIMIRRREDSLSRVDFPELDDLDAKPAAQPLAVKNKKEATLAVPEGDAIEKAKNLSGEEIMALAGAGGRLGRRGEQTTTFNALPSEETSTTQQKPDLETLYTLAREADKTKFCDAAARFSGMESSEIMKLVKSSSGDEIVYLVRALNFSKPKDIQILLMLSPRYGRNVNAFKAAKQMLSKLEIGICQMIFNQVGANFAIQGAPTPIEIEGTRNDAGFARSVQERKSHLHASRSDLTSARNATSIFGKKAS